MVTSSLQQSVHTKDIIFTTPSIIISIIIIIIIACHSQIYDPQSKP